jgi:hypothetical protein
LLNNFKVTDLLSRNPLPENKSVTFSVTDLWPKSPGPADFGTAFPLACRQHPTLKNWYGGTDATPSHA